MAKNIRSKFSVACLQCGKHFFPWKNHSEPKYCSRQCAGKARTDFDKVREGKALSDIRKMIAITCQFCKKDVLMKPSRKSAKFCSNKCRNLSRIPAGFSCFICGVHVTKTRNTDHPLCSRKCAGKYQRANHKSKRIAVQCSFCKAGLFTYACFMKIHKNHFCNRECRAAYITGEKNPAFTSGLGRRGEYGANWKKQRRAALFRDSSRCQHCGKKPKKTRYLHVHHMTPAYKFKGDYIKANDLSNLITLCHVCHTAAERGAIAVQPALF